MTHVSLITLGVDDIARATAFYEALGWRRSAASVAGTVAFLRGGASVLSLFGRHALADEAGVPAGSGRATSVALAMNVTSAQEVEATLAAAQAAGGTVTRAGTRAEWGGYTGYFTDPDGHLWEVAHNPGFALLDDGRVELPDDRV